MPVSPNFKSVHTSNFTVCFTQCTPQGYLKYTELCNLLQITAAAHADSGGISFTDLQHADQAWVLSRMRVEISELPKWRDSISVKTWIVSMENSRSVRALEVWCGDKKIIGCETFWAIFNTKSRRPEQLSLPYHHFELFAARFATTQRVSKVSLPPDLVPCGDHTVVLSDLDIVNHANHIKYLEWCLDHSDPSIVFQRKITSFDMNFMKELMFGDRVVILATAHDRDYTFALQKEGKNCFLLRLTTED